MGLIISWSDFQSSQFSHCLLFRFLHWRGPSFHMSVPHTASPSSFQPHCAWDPEGAPASTCFLHSLHFSWSILTSQLVGTTQSLPLQSLVVSLWLSSGPRDLCGGEYHPTVRSRAWVSCFKAGTAHSLLLEWWRHVCWLAGLRALFPKSSLDEHK